MHLLLYEIYTYENIDSAIKIFVKTEEIHLI